MFSIILGTVLKLDGAETFDDTHLLGFKNKRIPGNNSNRRHNFHLSSLSHKNVYDALGE